MPHNISRRRFIQSAAAAGISLPTILPSGMLAGLYSGDQHVPPAHVTQGPVGSTGCLVVGSDGTLSAGLWNTDCNIRLKGASGFQGAGQPEVARIASSQVLDKQQQLEAQTFWDNRDFDWYAEQIPFFECPDADITTTWYYRWDPLTKHLTYGSPNSGYSFTEFIDRPFWSGAYGAISCPAGHQLYEARWLRQPRIARDYLRYWFRTPGAQPRNYSTWLADSAWAVNQVHRDDALAIDLLPDLIENYEGWEQSKSETDWLEIDFGRAVKFRRVELAIYDDRGGVQPPA